MTRVALTCLGVGVLAITWLGPLPALAPHSFAAHMTMHMSVVAVAAPLLALAMAGSTRDPLRHRRWPGAPIAASMIELVVVWGWHAPALHQAARHGTSVLLLEQGSFLVAGLVLWATAFGGSQEQRHAGTGAGVIALLFTSMHMTLLGALFALANRPLLHHTGTRAADALNDQHLGGAIMLIVGGASYLIGGLWLCARMLRGTPLVPSVRKRVEG